MTDQTVSLDALQWKHRILLLPETERDSGHVDWTTHKEALLDRDLVLFRAKDGEYRQLFPKPNSPRALELPMQMRQRVSGRATLIGKDGGIKRQWKHESRELPAAVFSLIDSMPMRQREMQRQKEASTEHSETEADK